MVVGMATGRDRTARTRWQEWVIALAIAALFGIGVSSLWGASIRRWLGEMGGDDEGPPAARQVSGARL
jgi:hypothetical protein